MGRPLHLPQPAPGSGVNRLRLAEISANHELVIWEGLQSKASLKFECRAINFTHGWICERWCSTYFLLRSSVSPLPAGDPLIKVMLRERERIVTWPDDAPIPSTQGNDLVQLANRVFPWVVLPTLLHEVGHVVEQNSDLKGPALELVCDAFAIRYLLGKREDEFRDIVMLGLAIWLCCLCSEYLPHDVSIGKDHPNPVDRARNFLSSFVPRDTEMGHRVWALCTSHVMRLTRVHARSFLDTDVLSKKHSDLEELLEDLRRCWD